MMQLLKGLVDASRDRQLITRCNKIVQNHTMGCACSTVILCASLYTEHSISLQSTQNV